MQRSMVDNTKTSTGGDTDGHKEEAPKTRGRADSRQKKEVDQDFGTMMAVR